METVVWTDGSCNANSQAEPKLETGKSWAVAFDEDRVRKPDCRSDARPDANDDRPLGVREVQGEAGLTRRRGELVLPADSG